MKYEKDFAIKINFPITDKFTATSWFSPNFNISTFLQKMVILIILILFIALNWKICYALVMVTERLQIYAYRAQPFIQWAWRYYIKQFGYGGRAKICRHVVSGLPRRARMRKARRLNSLRNLRGETSLIGAEFIEAKSSEVD